MNNERWQEVERLYHSTLAKDATERMAFLAQACAGDEALRREVESLIALEPHAKEFIESPAVEVVAGMMAREHSAQITPGDRFNQYRIISHLGAGGMGEVYLAEDTSLRRKVALEMARIFREVDLMIVPSLRDEQLTITNFTGHPSLTLRAGFVEVSEARSDWAPDPANRWRPNGLG